MTDDETNSLPYGLWVEDALRGVVRRALEHSARFGLVGDQHYYISFRTSDAGVDIPGHLRARYPEEMTIVLQHQFWDLEVGTEAFSVSLRFGGRLSPLRIPFAAITGFGDPSVNFGLQFSGSPPPASSRGAAAEVSPQLPAQKPESERRPPAKADEAKGEGRPGGGDKTGRVIAIDTFRKK